MRPPDPIVIVISNPEADVGFHYRFRTASRWPARIVGIAITVAVHLLVSAPLILGISAHKNRPQTDGGPGSVAWASKGERFESMILLDLTALSVSSHEEMPEPRIDAEGIQPEKLTLQLVSLEPTPPQELPIDEADLAEESNEAAGDPAGNAALFGRYMGQLRTRIERAWLRPRSPVEGARFDCRARVVQDRQGNVLSVSLENCDANDVWRRSLTSAILRASPLSAPPEPWLFTEALTLTFAAEQYEPGRTLEYEYEPVTTRVAASHPGQPAFRDAGESPASEAILGDGKGDIELSISGDRTIWSRKKDSAASRH